MQETGEEWPIRLKRMQEPNISQYDFLAQNDIPWLCTKSLKITQLHGLFPQAAFLLPSLSPKLNVLYDYKVKRVKNEDNKVLAKQFIGALQRQKTFLVQNHVCRNVVNLTPKHDIEPSILPLVLILCGQSVPMFSSNTASKKTVLPCLKGGQYSVQRSAE